MIIEKRCNPGDSLPVNCLCISRQHRFVGALVTVLDTVKDSNIRTQEPNLFYLDLKFSTRRSHLQMPKRQGLCE